MNRTNIFRLFSVFFVSLYLTPTTGPAAEYAADYEAANQQFLKVIRFGRLKNIQAAFTKRDVEINYQEKMFKNTPLIEVLFNNVLKESEDPEEFNTTIKWLLDQGANPNQPNKHGRTPLIEAATHNFAEVIDLLVHYKADLDAQDLSECTALMHAVTFNHYKAAERLLKKGANVNKTQHRGLTALDIVLQKTSTRKENKELITLLKKYKAKKSKELTKKQ